jgi:hypothetical protein
MSHGEQLQRAVADVVGQRCQRAENPHGSILSIDLGPLGLRPDDAPNDKRHGWRHITVLSPWRLQSDEHVVADWNVDGGVHGLLPGIIRQLEGDTVVRAESSGPAWDLVLGWESGLTLFVFSDVTDERDSAWFILGTDGLEVSAAPEMMALP